MTNKMQSRQKARPRRYNPSAHSPTRTGGIPPWERMFKQNLQGLEIVKATYKENQPLIWRPLPGLSYENPAEEWEFTRIEEATGAINLGDWVRPFPRCALKAGQESRRTLSYPLHAPYDEDWSPLDCPYMLAVDYLRELDRNKTGPADWVQLITGAAGRSAPMPKAKILTLMYGQVYAQGGVNYFQKDGMPLGGRPDDPLYIVYLAGPLYQDLLGLMSAIKDNDEDDDPSEEYQYAHPNPVHPDGGELIYVNMASEPKPTGPVPRGQVDQSTKKEVGYKLYMSRRYWYQNVRQKPQPSLQLDEAFQTAYREKFQWWDDILRVPEAGQIAEYMAWSFPSYRKLFERVWVDHPEWWTDSVNGLFSNRTTSTGSDGAGDSEPTEPQQPQTNATKADVGDPVSPTTSVDTEDDYDDPEDFEDAEDPDVDVDEADEDTEYENSEPEDEEPAPEPEPAKKPVKKKKTASKVAPPSSKSKKKKVAKPAPKPAPEPEPEPDPEETEDVWEEDDLDGTETDDVEDSDNWSHDMDDETWDDDDAEEDDPPF